MDSKGVRAGLEVEGQVRMHDARHGSSVRPSPTPTHIKCGQRKRASEVEEMVGSEVVRDAGPPGLPGMNWIENENSTGGGCQCRAVRACALLPDPVP